MQSTSTEKWFQLIIFLLYLTSLQGTYEYLISLLTVSLQHIIPFSFSSSHFWYISKTEIFSLDLIQQLRLSSLVISVV